MKPKDVRQLELPAVRPVAHVSKARLVDPIPLLPTIRNLPTLHRSIEFARELSNLEDKQIYDVVGIDAGSFSRMTKGSAWYPQDERWLKTLNVMRTEIPVIWQVEALGYDWTTLRKHKTDLEERVERAEARVRELEHEREVERRCLADVFGGRR
jgi:hypothetical protein